MSISLNCINNTQYLLKCIPKRITMNGFYSLVQRYPDKCTYVCVIVFIYKHKQFKIHPFC